MSKDDLRSRLHDPDYWLGPPPTLGDHIRDTVGTALVMLILVPFIIVGFTLLGYILLGISVPVWVFLIWVFFFWGRPGTDSGPDEDR